MGRPPKDPQTEEKGTETVEQLQTENVKKSGVIVAIDEEKDKKDSYRGDCINCHNHGVTTELQDDGTCLACGFDKSKLHGAF